MSGVEALAALLQRTADEIKQLADPSLAIGKPMVFGDITVIPVSKAGFGVAGGGADAKAGFGGGSGGKAEITPLSFLVIQNGQVQVLSAAPSVSGLSDAVNGILTKAKEKIVCKKS